MPGRRVLIVNHENITKGRYMGEERNMLICNVLFRLGGAAVLLTNRSDPVLLQLCCRYRDAGQQISHHA